MRIDVNSDGIIDWNEFVSFMLLDKKSTKSSDHATTAFSLKPIKTTLPDKHVIEPIVNG